MLKYLINILIVVNKYIVVVILPKNNSSNFFFINYDFNLSRRHNIKYKSKINALIHFILFFFINLSYVHI